MPSQESRVYALWASSNSNEHCLGRSRSVGLADERSEIVALSKLQALRAQNGVGGLDVEEDVGDDEVESKRLTGQVPGTDGKNLLAGFDVLLVEGGAVDSLDLGLDLVDHSDQLLIRLEGLPCGQLEAGTAGDFLHQRVANTGSGEDLERQRVHVGGEASLDV